MFETIWQRRVQGAVAEPVHGRVLAAYNTNVDAIVHVTPEKLTKWLAEAPELDWNRVEEGSIGDVKTIVTLEDFFIVLFDRLAKGKSFHIVLEGEEIVDWLQRVVGAEKESMGGQAGIVANQMAYLGADALCYTSLLSSQQAALFHEKVKVPVVEDGQLKILPAPAAAKDRLTKINWILEYAKDEVFTVGSREIVTPRANRVILATRPKEAIMGFQEDMVPHLESLGREADLAFMAGYHYTEEVQADGRTWEEYLADTQRDLAALRSQNPNLRIHYEYVPMKVEELEPQVLTSICGQVQSFGVNENEIKRVLKNYGFTEEYEAIQADERAYTLYKGAVRLFRHWGLERLHVHNLGYYVVVLAKPYPVSVEKVRQACLYASAVNALKAKYGGYAQPEKLGETIDWPLSDIGFAQLRSAYTDLREEIPGLTEEFLATGILEQDDHYLLVVPSHVIPNPVSTVGMGDTISSSSYLAELDG